jgi:hypothetical protein
MWASRKESVKRRRWWWHSSCSAGSTSLSNHENINQHFFNIVSTFKQAFQELLPHVSLLKFCFPVKSTQTMCGNKKYIVGNILK